MSKRVENQYIPDVVSPPGETLRDLLEERGMSQAELAGRTGRPQKTISEIVNAKAQITVETALQLELALGVPAAFWNAREQRYREYLARREEEKKLERSFAWLPRFPISEMVKRGLLPDGAGKADQVRDLLRFLGVASPESCDRLRESTSAAFRKSSAFSVDERALDVWLRQGKLAAERVPSRPYDSQGFRAALNDVRALTREEPEVFQAGLVASCAEAGVVVVFVPEFPRCRTSGATRWLASDRALIQLSLRYRADDHLWFTFFHEAAHILLHGKRLIFIEGKKHEGAEEEEANRWATNHLIPPAQYRRLRNLTPYTKAKILTFAEECGVSPGIVVGRLQHERLINFSRHNGLKRRFKWAN